MSFQPADAPSQAAAKKARDGTKSVNPITIDGHQGFVIDWTSYGDTRLYSAIIARKSSGYFTMDLKCPAKEFSAARSDWSRLIGAVKLTDDKKSGGAAKKPAGGGAVEKSGFSVTLPDGWSENRSTSQSKQRAIIDYSAPEARGRLDIQEDNMTPATLDQLRPRSSNVKLLESSKVSMSGRTGVYVVTVLQDERTYLCHLDNGRGGRYVLHFSCLQADYSKMSGSFKTLLSRLKFQ